MEQWPVESFTQVECSELQLVFTNEQKGANGGKGSQVLGSRFAARLVGVLGDGDFAGEKIVHQAGFLRL